MSVITGIRIGLKIAKRIDRRYRYLDPTNKFIQKYVPPGYRARAFQAKRIADVAIGGGLIYDLLSSELDRFGQKPIRTNPIRQTRDHMEQSRTGRRYSKDKYPSQYCGPTKRKEFRYRSRYRF